jgi:hypothetical protein
MLWARLLDWIDANALGCVSLALVALVLGGAGLWIRQQDAQITSAQARSDTMATLVTTAEARAVSAEAKLTSIVVQQTAVVATEQTVRIAASATALARGSNPSLAVQRALSLVYAAYQQPSDERIAALTGAMTPDAVGVFRAELDHLLGMGLHLGGDSTYQLDVIAVQASGDEASVHTREHWVYDERDPNDVRQRCVAEDGEQVYHLHTSGQGFIVDGVQLVDVKRASC